MTSEDIAAAIAELDSRSKSNTHRLDKMEQRQSNLDQLVTCVAEMRKDMEHTQGDVREIKADVKALMDKPRSNWERVISAAISCLVSALVGAAMGLLLGA